MEPQPTSNKAMTMRRYVAVLVCLALLIWRQLGLLSMPSPIYDSSWENQATVTSKNSSSRGVDVEKGGLVNKTVAYLASNSTIIDNNTSPIYDYSRENQATVTIKDSSSRGVDVEKGGLIKNTVAFLDPNSTITDKNTVVAMIAFGNATKTRLVERCIRSIRARGQWNGYIVLLSEDSERYNNELVPKDPKVIVLDRRQADWEDLPPFKTEKMKAKRFKTLLFPYLQDDRRLVDMDHILYTDIDMVFGKPLLPWLEQKWTASSERRRQGLADGRSSMLMFEVNQFAGKVAHSGIMLLHRQLSKGCLRTWRQLFDKKRLSAMRDQALLRTMMKMGPRKTNCTVIRWPKIELIFPMKKDFEKRNFPQFVHITNTFHAMKTDFSIQKAYLQDALQLTEEERNATASLASVGETF